MSCRHFCALLWKNCLVKKRNPIGSCCEILLPVLAIGVMVGLFNAFTTNVFADQTGWTSPWPDPSNAVQRVQPLGCTPFRLQYVNSVLAVAPQSSAQQPLVDQFITWITATYPAFNGSSVGGGVGFNNPALRAVYVPSLFSQVMLFANEGALNSYITSPNYGLNGGTRIWGGIVFNNGAPNWDYSIRMNSSQVPDTTAVPVNILQRGINLSPVRAYTLTAPNTAGPPFLRNNLDPISTMSFPGFMTLQLMVDRFILNSPVTGGLPSLDRTAAGPLAALFQATLSYMIPAPMPSLAAELAYWQGVNPATAAVILTDVTNWIGLGESYAPQQVDLVPFPAPAYQSNGFYGIAAALLPFFFIIAFLFPVSRLVRGIVMEKEAKITEGMRMMGLGDTSLLSSWFALYFIMYFIIAVLVTIISSNNIFKGTAAGLVFLLFLLFGVSSLSFAYLISVFFSKARTASTIGVIIFIGAYFPFYAVNTALIDSSSKIAASLLSPTAFALGINQLAIYENEGAGITNTNAADITGNFAFSWAIGMMFFDTFLYLALAWYTEAVLPSFLREFGVPRPFYFPFTPSYWREVALSCGCRPKPGARAAVASAPGLAAAVASGKAVARLHNMAKADASFFEPLDNTLQAKQRQGECVSMAGLRKEFSTPDGIKVAVDDVDVTFFSGQVTCLLGHNGAGKSTLINMLTGLYPATDGTITALGADVRDDSFSGLRSQLGVCPQQDVLWPDLTVREHLNLYCALKGVPRAAVAREVVKVVAELGLTEKMDAPSANLSGGQKRKLSLAIALVGGSKIIIADEPTSGMDPYSRRSTWQAIQEAARAGRTFLLSTHFMDEADILGDRIIIMADGTVRCAGSSLFLKKRYGIGYVLTLVRGPGSDAAAIVSVLQRHVPEATVATAVGAELNVRLPLGASAAFAPMFAELDAGIAGLGVLSYGLGITTLEDVFIKAAENPDVLLGGHGGGSSEGGASETPRSPGSVAVSVSAPLDGVAAAREISLVAANQMRAGVVKNPAHSAAFPSSAAAAGAAADDRYGTFAGGLGGSVDESASLAPRKAAAGAGGAAAGGGVGVTLAEVRARARKDLAGAAGFAKHVRAILIKRFNYARRDLKTLLFQLLIPVVLVAAGLALIQATSVRVFPSLQLSTGFFNNNPRGTAGAPVYPNLVTTLSFKSDGDPTALAVATDVATLLGSIPTANATFTAPLTFDPTIGGSNLLQNVANSYNFFNASAPWQSPASDWQRLSSFLLANRNGYAASKYLAVHLQRAGTVVLPAAQDPALAFPTNNALTYAAYHNSTALHAAPLAVNLVNDAAYKRLTGNAAASISARTAPLPLTSIQTALFSGALTASAALIIIVAFSFIPASYAAFLIKERETGAKHQQLISGVSIPAYWIANYIFDCLSYLVPGFLAIVLCFAFNISDFTGSDSSRINALMGLFLLYGPAVAPFTYVLSYAFTSHSTGQNVVLFLNIGAVILIFVSIFMSQISSVCAVDLSLRFVYRLLPTYDLGYGLVTLSLLTQLPLLDATCNGGSIMGLTAYQATDLRATGWNLVYLGVSSVVYLALAIGIDQFLARPHLRAKLSRDPACPLAALPGGEDDDVQAERARVGAGVQAQAAAGLGGASGGASGGGSGYAPAAPSSPVSPSASPSASTGEDAILIDRLRKVFAGPARGSAPKVAVRDLSFGVGIGEVFGFLGINGAGKSTTLSILSGDLLPTSGTAKLGGYDILDQQSAVRRLLGYCPQSDPLLEVLTAREHLDLYARIKGVPEADLPRVVGEKLAELDLVKYANKKAGSLSGGNKRKLCVACALIGGPVLIFLDEPSTGMDPVARRFMWKVISRISNEQKLCSIILTSHAMEEVEALCQRVGILVGGQLQCVGTIQHLKSKFGSGYQLELKLETVPPEWVAAVEAAVRPLLHLAPPAVQQQPPFAGAGGAAMAASNPMAAASPVAAAAPSEGTGRVASARGSPLGALISRAQLPGVCAALGDPSRDAQVTEAGLGWALFAAFARSELPAPDAPPAAKQIPLAEFAAWWAEEDAVARALAHFTSAAFPGARLQERQGLTLRFKLPAASRAEPLGALFARVEAAKAGVAIASYSLSQVTLEQLFNSFASGSMNPEQGHARGLALSPGGEQPPPAAAAAAGKSAPGLGALVAAAPSAPAGPGSTYASLSGPPVV